MEVLGVLGDGVAYCRDVFFGAHEFEGMEERDVELLGEYFSYGGVVDSEVGVAAGDDCFGEGCVVFVVEEFCYLFWCVGCLFSVEGCSSAIGGADEDVGLCDFDGWVFDGDSGVREPEFLDEFVCVFCCG